ncbi:NACHT domain-containing protein [Ectopseudomonas toyotomiensis]|uniref:Uncharacterized protein n=1 Tax=Ectopseudomonas toyotomiensis TaxID=554344 RepID=A0AA42LKL1_9GAMM|nr:hypothetical protein [Pseudomonas toyotomiensis]MBG0843499.1 hypothetical protein [Pseudomonas toyotomiensis]MDH0701313.1 hypothetical protein [Pseudomonas toyotomiensis]
MIDRKVLADDGSVGLFSDFQSSRCIVLLGDSGAGKSHLFKAQAEQSAGCYKLVRNLLLTTPAEILPGSALFLDALDEYRVHYGDVPALDSLVKYLNQLQSCQVRIACRSADWMGSDDLQTLAICFPGEGAVRVLRLLPLDEEAQQLIISTVPQVESDFLVQARQRGLGEMLGNPLTLRMLAEVVAQTQWPRTRRELFERSISLLLAEYNSTHLNDRRLRSGLSAEELRRAAGLLCALRLLADIDGFSLQEQQGSRYAPLFLLGRGNNNITALRGALFSRVFSAVGEAGIFDYSHRAIAEYLAACYLCQLFQEGLPLSRVRLLLGGEGKPVSYLRGLHAWMPIELCSHADEFIDADPLGILNYGDAASLSSHCKQRLFHALTRLADSDPWFMGQEHSVHIPAGLAEPALVQYFERILLDPSRPHGLKILVLDTLLVGQPLPALLGVLAGRLVCPDAHLNECAYAAQVLQQMGEEGLQALRQGYSVLVSEKRDRRLRAFVLSRPLRQEARYQEVLELYRPDAQCVQDADVTLERWMLHELVATKDISDCLDDLLALDGFDLSEAVALDILSFMTPLISRYLESQRVLHEPRLFAWLAYCNALSAYKGCGYFQTLREALQIRQQTYAADQGLLLRAAGHPGLEGFPFILEPVEVAEEEGKNDRENNAAEEMSDDLLVDLLNGEILVVEEQLDGGLSPMECDPFLLGEVLFKLIKQDELAAKFWFQAFRQAHYSYYIDCLAQHLLIEIISSGLTHCLVLKNSKEIALTDKLAAIQRLLGYAPHFEKAAFYRLLRPYCRHLTQEQFGPDLLALLAEESAEQHHPFIITLGLLISLERFAPSLAALDSAKRNEVVWYLRDLTGLVRGLEKPMDMTAEQVASFCRLVADQYPATPVGSDWFIASNTRAEDADEFIAGLITFLADQSSEAAGNQLLALQGHPSLATWKLHLQHAVAINRTRQHDALHRRSSWQQVRSVLENGPPDNIMHMLALVMDELDALACQLRSNLDEHKFFWNETNGKIHSPKWEESCRDVLVRLLRPRLEARRVSVEPEGHMANDKRVDIAVQYGSIKLVIELKRASHPDLWTAIRNQLIALYTSDPGARGYGIYGVFWHGVGSGVTAGPGNQVPQSAAELKTQLEASIAEESRPYIKVFVLDVSGA